ncbi:MAG: SpoIID/LytB domain-containing protein [Candidatus Cloacimonetes bacterium]|jgi:SpoIID/LytB domain protein|nr:SpoIID/LytB domain-containing protein [Candidatus Cloacimonadota bacterium]MDY0337630.1 SpoIID/LytB domain-containing protein [Candidatus Cloacimonadaceae bacterium]
MRRILLILLLLMTLVYAAEFRDDVLYLEINLASGTTLQLSTGNGSIELSDESMLFNRRIKGQFQVSVVNPEVTSVYGILNREKPEIISDDAIVAQSFAWEDDHLVLKHELQYFYPYSFNSLDSARVFADEYGFPYSNIMAIPIVNSTLMVEDSQGQISYYESPLRLKSTENLIVNELPYADEFVLEIAQGKLNLNQIVALEEYIAGVLPNEIGPSSPLEALKAQAVAARTHAVSLLLNNRHRDQGYDLCSSTHCQVYKGRHLRNENIEEAVMQTAAEILTLDGRVADATYHSSCGGKTDSSVNIWNGAPLAHLSGATCYSDAENYDLSTEKGATSWINHKLDTSDMSSWEKASISWRRNISRATLSQNTGVKNLHSVQILARGNSGRILKLKLIGDNELILDGEFKIRQAFGNLPSSFFSILGARLQDKIMLSSSIDLAGRGSGHGVGLCQMGTLRKARAGSTYSDILQNYYPNTIIFTDWIHDEE